MPIPLQELCALIDPAKTTLIMGAGASIPSGAPSGPELARQLWDEVAKSGAESDDLIETATILERRYGRKAVIDTVRDTLKSLRPKGGLLALPAFPWKQIFSTNFDCLIEQSYKSRGVPLATMRSNYDLSNRDPGNRVTLFKIHGCITQDRCLGDKPSMILTEDDYEEYGQFRQTLFSSLKSALLIGDVLVIGQSLRDRHLSDLVKEILRAKLEGAPGQTYVLVYDKDDLRAPLLEDKGARIAFGGIDQFLDQLSQEQQPTEGTDEPESGLLPVELVSSIIDVQSVWVDAPNVVKMFNGGSATYADIKSGATFERIRTNDIVDILVDGKKSAIVITGSAGVGKSTMCRQILCRLVQKGFLAWEQREDLPFRHEPWIKIEAELRRQGKQAVLFLDECTHFLRSVNLLIDHLKVVDRPALSLVLSANSAQWAPRVKTPNLFKIGAVVELSNLENPELNSLINLVEFNAEIAALVHSPFKSLSRSDQFNALRRKASADMFVCLKNIFANESLDAIVLREFEEIHDNLQALYRYVAALEAVGMKVHRHLLIRMLTIEPNQINAALAGLTGIIEEYDISPKEGIYGWRTRHLVIARKIAEYKFSGANELLDLFNLIIDNINPAIQVERFSISNICDSEYGIGRIGDETARLSLYKRLTKIVPGERVPWHRVVREYLNMDDIEGAEYAIRDAEQAVGYDAPLSRYKVRLVVLRSQKTRGISATDRCALLRKAYEMASANIANYQWDRHSYRALCDVALLLNERGVDVHLIEEAIHKTRLAAAEICDPEMMRDLQRVEAEKQRATRARV